jgi:prepilin-type N-terminal cleavage/methylation domain-containing protein
MKRRSPAAFTLIEMITVVAIIVVLAGLVISTAGYVNNKAARDKATAVMKAISLQLDAYKNDSGAYPSNADTDLLDPRKDFNPIAGASAARYQSASRYLYSALTGDFEPPNRPDGKPEEGSKVYYTFKREELNATRNSGTGEITGVLYIVDPFGYPYGYSTAAARAEEEYREKLRVNASEPRPTDNAGYNTDYDLWSTGGASNETQKPKWVKNW